jgi:hypothetical protein
VEEELMLRKDDISEVEMTPKVGVCAAHRVGDHDREQDDAGRRAEQRAASRPRPDIRRLAQDRAMRGGSISAPHHLFETHLR